MKKNCKRCGKEFEPKHPSRLYCGPTCKQYAYFERNGLSIGTKNPALIPAQEIKPVNEEKENLPETVDDVNKIPETQGVYTVNQPDVTDKPGEETNPPSAEEKQIPQAVDSVKENAPVESVIDMKELDRIEKQVQDAGLPTEKIIPAFPATEIKKPEETEKPIPQPVSEKFRAQEKQTAIQPPVNKLPVKSESKPPAIPQPQPLPQKPKPETFMQKLNRRASEGKGASQFTKENYPQWKYDDWNKVHWVNERVKSHFKRMLEMSKKVSDLKEVKYLCEKIKEIIDSYYFRYLPWDYPYSGFIKIRMERFQQVVQNMEKNRIEKISMTLLKEDYIEIKAILFEIGTTVPTVDHSKPPAPVRDLTFHKRRSYLKQLGIPDEELGRFR